MSRRSSLSGGVGGGSDVFNPTYRKNEVLTYLKPNFITRLQYIMERRLQRLPTELPSESRTSSRWKRHEIPDLSPVPSSSDMVDSNRSPELVKLHPAASSPKSPLPLRSTAEHARRRLDWKSRGSVTPPNEFDEETVRQESGSSVDDIQKWIFSSPYLSLSNIACSSAAAVAHSESLQDQVFSPERIRELGYLGEGFYGIVKRVQCRNTGHVMCMKTMKHLLNWRSGQSFSTEDVAAAQEQFSHELWVLRRLSRPEPGVYVGRRNVLEFLGIMFQNSVFYLLTEYVDGGSLELHIENSDLCWLVRLRFARDIAAGMSYLHRKGIIHRDLNSQNCLVRTSGVRRQTVECERLAAGADRSEHIRLHEWAVVVADFGLARFDSNMVVKSMETENDDDVKKARCNNAHMSTLLVDSDPEEAGQNDNEPGTTVLAPQMLSSLSYAMQHSIRARHRMRKSVVGHTFFMAPEMVARLEQGYDRRVDVFSYGIVFCELLSWQRADPDKMREESHLGKNNGFPFSMSKFDKYQMRADCPPSLANHLRRIVQACCQTWPPLRPAFSSLWHVTTQLYWCYEAGRSCPAKVSAVFDKRTLAHEPPADGTPTNGPVCSALGSL